LVYLDWLRTNSRFISQTPSAGFFKAIVAAPVDKERSHH